MGCASSKPAPKPPVQSPPLSTSQPEQVSKVKLVLLGDSGVGKSCLVQRYVRGAFDPSNKITVGAAFQSHTVRLPDGQVLKLEIWDTAGQERYASLAPLYYRGAAAAIVVYDVTSKSSFAKAKHWISELHKNASDNLVVALVGNKTDLVDSRVVTQEEGAALAEGLDQEMSFLVLSNSMIFVETSARTAANCGHVFEEIAKAVTGYQQPLTAGGPAKQESEDRDKKPPAAETSVKQPVGVAASQKAAASEDDLAGKDDTAVDSSTKK